MLTLEPITFKMATRLARDLEEAVRFNEKENNANNIDEQERAFLIEIYRERAGNYWIGWNHIPDRVHKFLKALSAKELTTILRYFRTVPKKLNADAGKKWISEVSSFGGPLSESSSACDAYEYHTKKEKGKKAWQLGRGKWLPTSYCFGSESYFRIQVSQRDELSSQISMQVYQKGGRPSGKFYYYASHYADL